LVIHVIASVSCLKDKTRPIVAPAIAENHASNHAKLKNNAKKAEKKFAEQKKMINFAPAKEKTLSWCLG